MACYSPWKITRDPYNVYYKSGKDKVKFIGKFNADTDLQDLKDGVISLVPCGKCLGCRLDYARSWSDRMVLEYQHWKKAIFVTLTYNDDHLTKIDGIPTLVKEDISRFMKNLRGRKEFLGRTIRFFSCGEYGEHYHRPHVHIIIFNIDLELLKEVSRLIYKGQNELKQIYWECPLLDSVWSDDKGQIGYVQVSEASWNTMNYVARYTLKKVNGNSWTKDKPILDEFILMSRRPGIGAPFLDSHFAVMGFTDVWHDNGKAIYFPKYMQKKYWSFGINHIEVLDDLGYATHILYEGFHDEYKRRKEKRIDLVTSKFIEKFENDSRTYNEIINTDLLYKEESIKKLKRGDAVMC